VAELAVALRLSPAALLSSDDEVLDALIGLAERERTNALYALEVQALTAELVYALWRLTLQVNSKKGSRPPQPLRLPRPWRDKQQPARRKVTVGQLIAMTGKEG
jgi:hypothetical protein